jgi:hypothetical protein
MPDIDTTIERLNRLFILYSRSVESKSVQPYRISRLKEYLELLLLEVSKEFPVVEFDSEAIWEYFPALHDQLKPIKQEKEEAVRLQNYEQAAQLKDHENVIIKNHLLQRGVPANVFFFQFENKIFKV